MFSILFFKLVSIFAGQIKWISSASFSKIHFTSIESIGRNFLGSKLNNGSIMGSIFGGFPSIDTENSRHFKNGSTKAASEKVLLINSTCLNNSLSEFTTLSLDIPADEPCAIGLTING